MPNQTRPYEYYLGLLGQWPTSIALASQWMITIYFDSVSGLFGNLQNSLQSRELHWNIDSGVVAKLIDGSLQSNSKQHIGCVFARQVNLPGESIDAGNIGLDYGGFTAPAIANTRSKYTPLTVTMLETNASFLDFIIRPWIVLTSYNGLVARQKNSPKYVKADAIDVVMYAKTGAGNEMGVRKVYRFYGCAPIGLDGETYSYTEEGLRYSNVQFAYDRYSILSEDSGSLINLP